VITTEIEEETTQATESDTETIARTTIGVVTGTFEVTSAARVIEMKTVAEVEITEMASVINFTEIEDCEIVRALPTPNWKTKLRI
jgi:hypothetical protein